MEIIPKEVPRNKWIKTKCKECGAINESYWDENGFLDEVVYRCMCRIKNKSWRKE